LGSVIDFSGYPGLGALPEADVDRAFSAFTNAILLGAPETNVHNKRAVRSPHASTAGNVVLI